jgi:hypothetical protein
MADEPDLLPGEISEWVTYLQQTLNHYYQQAVVAETGTFDEATAAIVQQLRDHVSLPAGAHVDAALWMLMLAGDSDPAAIGTSSSSAAGTSRGLDPGEVAAARQVFGDTLATDVIVLAEGGPLTVGGYVRTLPDLITFPDDLLTNPPSYFTRLLVHELGHCWQYQQGAGIPALLVSAIGGDYDYGGTQGLIDAAAAGRPFADFGYEEQGDIFEDYYVLLVGGDDTSAYEPYLQSVRDGTWREAPVATSVP